MKVFFDPLFLKHKKPGHPECPERLSHALAYLEELGVLLQKPSSGEGFLELAHDGDYVERVHELSFSGGGMLDPDTYVNEFSYGAACLAVGAAVDSAKIALEGKSAFALVRPPGHHAKRASGAGFCIFNNMAIAAKWLSKQGKKVLVFDWDVHAGDGTEEIVEGDENILVISTHQHPLYPGTCLESSKNIVNITFPPGAGDAEYLKKALPVLREKLREFKPDVVGVSAGFDSYTGDKGILGNYLELTEKAYTSVLKAFRDKPVFFCLEGGYAPESVKMGLEVVMSYFNKGFEG